MSDDIRDVIIIGSGPAGYTAAIYAARADLQPLVFEGAVTAGGALMNTTEVENFPGFPDGIQGPELMENLRGQAERFGAELVPDDVIAVAARRRGQGGRDRRPEWGGQTTHRARAVILATGSAYRELGLPGEKRLSGHGVSWCATCDGFFFRDQDIAVVGGGDSALEEATFLTRFARSVTIVHRRDTLRASKIMQARAHGEPEDHASGGTAEVDRGARRRPRSPALRLRDVVTGEESELRPSPACSWPSATTPASSCSASRSSSTTRATSPSHGRSGRTNVPGVFACGDVVDHEYRQAITAAGSGCAAALDAERYLAALADEGDPDREGAAHSAAATAAAVAS